MRQDQFLVPARRVETEFIEQKSRFITNAAPVFSVSSANDFVSQIKNKYPDANHHVSAFLIGHGNSVISHCSDDGEPAGTAGKPALAVLQGSGLGDIAVVISRFFGGTKLGTGGLVRAYSDSMRLVLEDLPRAKKVATTTVMCVVDYSHYEQAKLLVHHHGGLIKDQYFGADVTMTIRFEDVYLELFKQRMVDLSRGNIDFIEVDRCKNTIMPFRNKKHAKELK